MQTATIKFLTDTASDISEQTARTLGIDVMPIPLTVDGKGYFEGIDFTADEFYNVLLQAKTIPSTSHITPVAFSEKYAEIWKQGSSCVIHITICSNGSNMFASAQMGRDMFYQEHPEAKEPFPIYILDSKNYSITYGHAVVLAAQMAAKGADVPSILDFLEDYFNSLETYFSVYSLDFAKKSGRISCAAAFVGDILGLRPIISIIDGEIKIIDKVRGDKNVIPRLTELASMRAKPGSPYGVLQGAVKTCGPEMEQSMKEALGYESFGIYQTGASISINTGPKVVGVCVLGQNRAEKIQS